MTNELSYILPSVIIISLASLIGIFFLGKNKKFFNKFIMILVAFASGAMLGTSFFDLIPESFENLGNFNFVIIGLIIFFVLESLIHWHHSHRENCEKCFHPVVYLNILGDGLHNFLDGIIIAASFLVNIPTGVAVSIAILLHEIPQEIGDFAVLVHGGLSKTKALLFNFLSATLAILGAIFGYLFLTTLENIIPYVIAIAAGSFIYIAVSDLFPELHKENNYLKIILQILFLVLGVIVIWFVFGGGHVGHGH